MTHGFPELGDFAGMGIGATTKKVLYHPKYLTEPHVVCFLVYRLLLKNLVTD